MDDDLNYKSRLQLGTEIKSEPYTQLSAHNHYIDVAANTV